MGNVHTRTHLGDGSSVHCVTCVVCRGDVWCSLLYASSGETYVESADTDRRNLKSKTVSVVELCLTCIFRSNTFQWPMRINGEA